MDSDQQLLSDITCISIVSFVILAVGYLFSIV